MTTEALKKMEDAEKDKILQQVFDTLEAESWGGCSQSLSLELFFKGKFNCDILVRSKNKSYKKEI